MENASKALIIAGAILIAILLISIGIILVNAGSDVTETGTSGMQSQQIQSFNSQFTAYEGKRNGSQLRGLQSLVNASNASDSVHQVTLSGWSSTLESTKEYNVEIGYDENTGYVNSIKISE